VVGVLVAQVVSTLWLAGMIWTIQVVHYPLFDLVGRDGFSAYEAAHSTRISLLLLGPWAVQGITTAWILLSRPVGVPWWMVLAAAALAASTVLVTVLVSVPQHEVLSGGFDAAAHATLVSTNWWRTLAWTGHAVLAVWMLVLHVRATS
jgi:hypothetical protein